MPSLAELREQIRLARIEKEWLAKKIASHSTSATQKEQAVQQYNIIVGNLRGMASDLENEIKAIKRAMAERRRM
jgi:tRNA 2-selenouridine synthase SelU